jgi:hypothetical protein
VTKIFVEHELLRELLNLPPQTFMSWNALTLACNVESVTKLNQMSSPGALPKIMGTGSTIP